MIEPEKEIDLGDLAEEMLQSLREAAPAALRKWLRERRAFERRTTRRWKHGLEALEFLCEIAHELGSTLNDKYRPEAVAGQDFRFEALTSLHVRALLITQEILCLLRGGFPDGALARWRSLHETAVHAVFLSKAHQDTSHRFLMSFHVRAWQAAQQLEKHAERANMEPFSEKEMQWLKTNYDSVVAQFGSPIAESENGWASPTIKRKRPKLSDLEVVTGLDHWRPRYRWASQHTHASHRPFMSYLGMSEATMPMLMAVSSNSGITDPAHMTAISLLHATTSLLLSRQTVDYLLSVVVLQKLVDDVGAAFSSVEPHDPRGEGAR